MKIEDIKIGMRVKKPTKKTKGDNFDVLKRTDWLNGKVFTVTNVLHGHGEVVVKSNTSISTWSFSPEDLDKWEETKYEGIYIQAANHHLLCGFLEQIRDLKLRVYLHSKDTAVLYLQDEVPYNIKCNKFILPIQYMETLVFAEEFAKSNKPKEYLFEMNGFELLLRKKDIQLQQDGRLATIEDIKNMLSVMCSGTQLFNYDVSVDRLKIGCSLFTIEDIYKVLDKHKEVFG